MLIAAASDLSRLEPEFVANLLKQYGIHVKFVSGSSGQLARQISSGAPYDVFLSANERYVRELVTGGHLLGDSARVYARGRLGLWSKSGQVRTLGHLARPEVIHIAMANPAHAPYGLAARQLLEKMGLWAKLQPKIVFGENVRQALQFAESGNAEAVLTSWSLVFDRGGVLLPEDGHAPILQAGGVVATSRLQPQARKALDYLASPDGQQLLRRWGLFPPKKGTDAFFAPC